MSTTINPAGVNTAGVSTIGANAMKLRAEQPAETSVTGNVLNQKAEQPIEAPAAETPAFRGKCLRSQSRSITTRQQVQRSILSALFYDGLRPDTEKNAAELLRHSSAAQLFLR